MKICGPLLCFNEEHVIGETVDHYKKYYDADMQKIVEYYIDRILGISGMNLESGIS